MHSILLPHGWTFWWSNMQFTQSILEIAWKKMTGVQHLFLALLTECLNLLTCRYIVKVNEAYLLLH